MNDSLKEILTKIKARYSRRYGLDVDEWSGILFTEIESGFLLISKKVEQSTKKIEEAAQSIKGKVHQINLKSPDEAFKLGLGFTTPVAIMGVAIAVLIFCYKTNTEEYLALKRIAQSYEHITSYQILMQHGEIVKREGQYFLTLSLANKGAGDMLIGKEYVFDGRTKRILIPLGRN